ncbi:LuxR family transcriptional regulator [Kitasatospora cheerisanensis KCTC 2395]|uniref:LuxR family transcriptional regulator n=1 Tax=Kitasatospora cheerisanensis KCTC 2395 TaxID=1348663 RepID=A0A066Z454_9ACTN|nr:LuxR family transcriptional regulator [Kitasatospora cheerisanensis KCTC 2395]
MPIRVMLVDDQELLRTGFRMVLQSQGDIEIAAEAGDGQQALDVLRTAEVDVILMDVRMPRLDGVQATRRICLDDRGTPIEGAPRVLILTTFDLDEYAFAALKAGASGFLLKDVPPTELVAAIRAVHGGDAVVAPTTTRRMIDRFAEVLPTPTAAPARPSSPRSPSASARSSCWSPRACPTARSPPAWCSPRPP